MKTCLVLIVLLCIIGQGSLAHTPFENSQFMDVLGVELHYRLWETEAEPELYLLFIHGLGGSTYSWQGLAEALAHRGYGVVAVDVPPFGYSQRQGNIDFSRKGRSELLWQFWDALAYEVPLVLGGHSMGGSIATEMAKRGDVEGMVLVAPALLTGGSRGGFWFQFSPIRRVAAFFLERFFITEDRLRSVLESAYGRAPSQEEFEAYYYPLTLEGTWDAFFRMAQAGGEEAPVLQEGMPFQRPTLILWGAEDTWVPVVDAQTLEQYFPRLKLRIVEQAGHVPQETHGDWSLKQVLEFLEGLGHDTPSG